MARANNSPTIANHWTSVHKLSLTKAIVMIEQSGSGVIEGIVLSSDFAWGCTTLNKQRRCAEVNKCRKVNRELEASYSSAQMQEDPQMSLIHQHSENNDPAEAAIRIS